MSLLLTPIRTPPSAYFNHRDSVSSSAFLPKHVAFIPRRADAFRVSAQGRSWWDSDSESTPRKRSSKSWVLDDDEEDEGGKGSWWSRSFDDYDGYYDDEIDSAQVEDESDWTDVGLFKVLKSYGWMLPAILISMLLATGPKAFLMALALPLGQSALSFAVDKLWGKAGTVRKPPRSKSRKQKFAGSSAADSRQWKAPRDTASEESNRESWDAYGKATGARSTYGGWDEVDIKGKGSSRQPASPRPNPEGANRTGPQRKSKMIRRGRNADMPLLLRLLIAVFPFLGSWVKIL